MIKLVDLIYDFINNVLIGDSTLPGKTQLATLLTYTTIILFFALLVKLIKWIFNYVNPKIRR